MKQPRNHPWRDYTMPLVEPPKAKSSPKGKVGGFRPGSGRKPTGVQYPIYIGLFVSKELRQQIKGTAQLERQSYSAIVRGILENYFAEINEGVA